MTFLERPSHRIGPLAAAVVPAPDADFTGTADARSVAVNPAIESDEVAQRLAPAVKQLFSATLVLAMAAAKSDAAMSVRLLGAVAQIDAAIVQLRQSLLAPPYHLWTRPGADG